MLQVKLSSQPHCLHKQEAASEHLLLLVHVSRRRLHTRQVSFSSLSLHFHILSHLELGDTHRCGEHFCRLPYWTSSPLQLPSSHKCRPLVPLPLTVNSAKMKPMQSLETYIVSTGYLRLSRVSLHSLIVEMNIPTPWNVKEFLNNVIALMDGKTIVYTCDWSAQLHLCLFNWTGPLEVFVMLVLEHIFTW